MIEIKIRYSDMMESEKISNFSVKDSSLSSDITINQFHDLCKKLAYAYGYSAENIEEMFGETIIDI